MFISHTHTHWVSCCDQAYSQCEQLLDSDGACGGVFRPDIPDPEMSQAGSTLLWELTLYSVRHQDSAVYIYIQLVCCFISTGLVCP